MEGDELGEGGGCGEGDFSFMLVGTIKQSVKHLCYSRTVVPGYLGER